MKKTYLIVALMIGLFLSVSSCRKQDSLPTVGKMQLPKVSLVQGSELITKSAGNTITNITYEFWVKAPNGGTNGSNVWVLGSNALYKDGSTAQQNNSAIWTLPYPPTSYTFIEVPLNMETRVVAKGTDNDGVKYYGIYDTGSAGWTTTTIPEVTINMYEIDSRLNVNVDNLLLNRNFDFHFYFSGHIKNVDYDGIVQQPTPWLLNIAPNIRNFNGVSLLTTPNTQITETLDIIGAGSMTGTPTINITGVPSTNGTITSVNVPVTISNLTTPSTFTVNPSMFSIYELFHQGCSDFTVSYTIVRKDGYVVVPLTPIVMTVPTTNGFNPANWCQAGFNFNITFTADPQKLGSGVFTGTLTVNDTVTGTITL